MSRSALVTGAAGFIGSHVVDNLLSDGWHVVGVDNFDAFYSPALKRRNVLAQLDHDAYTLAEIDIRNAEMLDRKLEGSFDAIVHLAGRAGVRPSISTPGAYLASNIEGTQNLLELARRRGVPQFVFASSSSVYGISPGVPWSETVTPMPISPYAATKLSAEALGHVYSHLHGLRFLALRFFTVYGPRQRPDLAIRAFAERMLRGEPVRVHGDGSAQRDFTYVLDTVQGIRAAIDYALSPFEIFNLGNNRAISVQYLVHTLEHALGLNATIEWQAPCPGDVPLTLADITKAQRLLGYNPQTPFEAGVERFVTWLLAQRTSWTGWGKIRQRTSSEPAVTLRATSA